MKKRLLSIALVLCMLLAMMPTALATDETSVAQIGNVGYATLADAVAAAKSGDTITLLKPVRLDSKIVLPKGVILDGDGNTLTCSSNLNDTFILADAGSAIQNITIDATTAKHAVQFYCVDGGTIDGAVINGGYYTSVIVNGATNIEIKNSTLNTKGYANIEYGVGQGVTVVPSLTLDNVKLAEGNEAPLVYTDETTMKRIAQVTDNDELTDEQRAAALTKVNKNVKISGMEIKLVHDVYIAVPHEHTADSWRSDSEKHWKVCDGCGESFEEATHTWDEGKVTTEPTTIEKGVKTYTCEVCGATKTEKIPEKVIPATKLTLTADKTSAKVGETVALTVKAEPENTTDSPAITVSDEKIATVTKDLKVKLLAPGIVTITAKAGDVEASIKITANCDFGAGCSSKSFKDIPAEDTWYHSAVDYVLAGGIMQGRLGKIFDPEADLTRAELAQILYNMAGEPTYTTGKTFPDVAKKDWFYDAVMWASTRGIITGYEDDTFKPNQPLTRQEMVVMIWRYYGKLAPENADAALSQFPDSKEGVWNKEAFAWMVENEYVNGKDGKLASGAETRRCEVAQILMKMGAKIEAD